MRPRKAIRIELTAEQNRQILEATGKDAKAIEITLEEIEEQFPDSAERPLKRGIDLRALALLG